MKAFFESIPHAPGESFACRAFSTPRFTAPWHFHPELELTLIVRGFGTRYVGDSIEPFEDGDLVFLGAGLPHYWWTDATDRRMSESVVIQFLPDFAGDHFLRLPEAEAIAALFHRARRGIALDRPMAAAVAGRMPRIAAATGWKRLNLLFDVLGILADLSHPRLLSSPGFSPDLNEKDAGRLTAVCKYVNDSYSEPIRHARAATLASLSPAAFSRFFHRRMGKTFEAYVTEIRIGHACRLLRDRDAGILEIAFAVGFNNLSNFNRHFRRLKRMTPRRFRQLSLASPAAP